MLRGTGAIFNLKSVTLEKGGIFDEDFGVSALLEFRIPLWTP
jgi:hypothetical protein